jgi:8-oxo-dGTP pyrophosphatase MutT (NUDIX family)
VPEAISREPETAVVALIHRDGRVLFVQRSSFAHGAVGYWCPVSGRVEADETQEEAVVREVREEVGLEVAPVRKVAEVPTPDGRYRLHYWTTDLRGGDARPISREVAALKWVTLDEMRELEPTFEEDLEVVEEAFAAGSSDPSV